MNLIDEKVTQAIEILKEKEKMGKIDNENIRKIIDKGCVAYDISFSVL